MYDPDAVNETKKYGIELRKHTNLITVGFLKEKDPGDLSLIEMNKIFLTRETLSSFLRNKVQKRQLK